MIHPRALWLSCFLAVPLAASGAQLPKSPAPARAAAAPAAAEPARPALSNKDVAATQRQLIEILRLSPTLTSVVARDPSLLSDQDYISRNNPQLADFLAAHPEVARNPAFYLFTHMNPQDGSPDEALEREVWPEMYHTSPRRSGFDEFVGDALGPIIGMLAFLAAVVWGIRIFIENRRWNRIFKLQSEVHGRLIDKFSSSQELAAYMETDAGKRFLEAAPIPLHMDSPQRVPSAVARILTPVQIGTVLVLLGIGFLLLRNLGVDYHAPMKVLGVLMIMPGIGFILSAGFTWILAQRLGLMPLGAATNDTLATHFQER